MREWEEGGRKGKKDAGDTRKAGGGWVEGRQGLVGAGEWTEGAQREAERDRKIIPTKLASVLGYADSVDQQTSLAVWERKNGSVAEM